MTTYRLRITLDSYGDSEEYAERLLEGFAASHPEVGPIVSQNALENTLTVVFSLEAADDEDALGKARPIFLEGAKASGLRPRPIAELTVSRISAPRKRRAPKATPALQPC
jgi:hypothetical protein